ncbi:hypothetical protein JTE90_002397 [Oedothorax gibbosus]|uniref:Uncharacterized protein n=1 Tax=Oedothorax gibbosus TaxID=931172 RepID=A0AAV6TJJ2_9ARAC|nr:hypothetical protein JTE90_002397 [Oedothorax gibbosus]
MLSIKGIRSCACWSLIYEFLICSQKSSRIVVDFQNMVLPFKAVMIASSSPVMEGSPSYMSIKSIRSVATPVIFRSLDFFP